MRIWMFVLFMCLALLSFESISDGYLPDIVQEEMQVDENTDSNVCLQQIDIENTIGSNLEPYRCQSDISAKIKPLASEHASAIRVVDEVGWQAF